MTYCPELMESIGLI